MQILNSKSSLYAFTVTMKERIPSVTIHSSGKTFPR